MMGGSILVGVIKLLVTRREIYCSLAGAMLLLFTLFAPNATPSILRYLTMYVGISAMFYVLARTSSGSVEEQVND